MTNESLDIGEAAGARLGDESPSLDNTKPSGSALATARMQAKILKYIEQDNRVPATNSLNTSFPLDKPLRRAERIRNFAALKPVLGSFQQQPASIELQRQLSRDSLPDISRGGEELLLGHQ